MTSLEELAAGPPLDAAVIGGGINGCAITRELAMRGLRVALFEKDDFGFGTTWRSTKLIHGGLRYLEHGDVRLVFESLRERAWLLRTRPHLVRRQPFLLPLVEWSRRPAWQMRAGLAAYDLMGLGGGLPRHRGVGADAARKIAPGVAPLSGGIVFWDARADSPERLALELALEAREQGAAIFNHAAVEEVAVSSGSVTSVTVSQSGRSTRIAARAVVNAAGPWVDAVNRLAARADAELLDVTRGTHIVLDVPGERLRAAVLSTARSDGRVFFVIPRDGLLLAGTTDDRFDGPPDAVRPTRADVDYLLAEVRALLPGTGIEARHVRHAYAGLRPLQRSEGGPEAAISRRHEVVLHGEHGGPAGLFSVAGGKLSTFRPLAEDVARALGAPARKTERDSLPSVSVAAGRLRQYGKAAAQVAAMGSRVICEHTGAIEGEVVHAVKCEQASTLSDIVMRRTGLAWTANRGLCCLEEIAGIAGRELGWDPAERARQVRQTNEDIRQHLPALDEVWG